MSTKCLRNLIHGSVLYVANKSLRNRFFWNQAEIVKYKSLWSYASIFILLHMSHIIRDKFLIALKLSSTFLENHLLINQLTYPIECFQILWFQNCSISVNDHLNTCVDFYTNLVGINVVNC